MKYRQTCPECYFDVLIDSLDDRVKICPKCKGRDIARQKVYAVEKETYGKNNEQKNINEDDMEEKKCGSDEIDTWEDIVKGIGATEILSSNLNQMITFKYISGIINNEFEIEIKSDSCPCLLGRSGLGKEYFQYDTRVSNEHCYIRYSEGEWLIKDDNSTNGTQINKKRLQPQEEIKIKNGDLIKLGMAKDAVELEVVINAAG